MSYLVARVLTNKKECYKEPLFILDYEDIDILYANDEHFDMLHRLMMADGETEYDGIKLVQRDKVYDAKLEYIELKGNVKDLSDEHYKNTGNRVEIGNAEDLIQAYVEKLGFYNYNHFNDEFMDYLNGLKTTRRHKR